MPQSSADRQRKALDRLFARLQGVPFDVAAKAVRRYIKRRKTDRQKLFAASYPIWRALLRKEMTRLEVRREAAAKSRQKQRIRAMATLDDIIESAPAGGC